MCEAAGPGGERGRGGTGRDDGGGPAGSRAAGWERRSPRGAAAGSGEVSGEAGRCHCEERDGGRAGERGERVTSSRARRGCCSSAAVSSLGLKLETSEEE